MLSESLMIGPYRLVRRLGAGTFGEVWLARHMDLGREFALKVPTDPDYVKQLRKEGVLTFSVRHPNVVEMHTIDTWHDPPYLAMEYVEGENLRQRLDRERQLPLAEALRIIRQVLSALQAAHSQGIVHRDLKPSNILLARDGTAKVADFGLGKAQANLVQSLVLSGSMTTVSGRSISGTVAYMSPEQQAGGEPTRRDDVYAVGVITCELLTGRRPSAVGVSALMRRAVVPEAVAAVVESACDEPAFRYASAAEMLEAIEALRSAEYPAPGVGQAPVAIPLEDAPPPPPPVYPQQPVYPPQPAYPPPPVYPPPAAYPPPAMYPPPPMYPPPVPGPVKSRMAAGLLGILLGGLGIHRFYLGYTGVGMVQLLMCVFGAAMCFIPTIVASVWGFVEGICILAGAFGTDARGRPLKD